MTKSLLAAFLVLGVGSAAWAQTLTIDPGIVTRADSLKATLKLEAPMTGDGTLTLTWTDCWGRTVATESKPVKVTGDSVPIALPLARAVAALNFLEAKLKVGGAEVAAPKAQFVVTPSGVWDDYCIIEYTAYPKPAQQWALRELGFTAGKISSGSTQDRDGGREWWSYGYPYYCTQISKHMYAPYHTPALNPKNKAFIAAKELYRKDKTKKDAFFRDPSLSDPQALAAAVELITNAVKAQMRFKPLYYCETDEGGVAELSTAWDFDFSPPALAAMRKWLLGQYGSLEAINKEWGTTFAKIDDVVPLSTDEMMARGDDNLSPWADHRFFMNKAFADAVRAGVDAGHAVDKDARIGLEGCQIPSAFGGYDYWLLGQALDCCEPYDVGNLWRSLASGKPAVSTAFGFGDKEIWRLWYQALHGERGLVVYDDKHAYVDADGKPTPNALSIAPTYKELTGGIVKQLHYSKPMDDSIAVHYSQPSITAHWMFQNLPAGKAWAGRVSSYDRKNSDFLRLRESWTKLVEDNLHPCTFVAYGQLENGSFDKGDCQVLILPQSVAMSPAECKAARDLVARGGTVIADCRTAVMDGHCRMLPKGQLDDLFGIERSDTKFSPGQPGLKPIAGVKASFELPDALAKVPAAEPGIKVTGGAVALYEDANKTPAVIVRKQGKGMTIYLNAVVTDYHRWRLKPPEGDTLLALVSNILKETGVKSAFDISANGKSVAGVDIFPFDCGNLKILGLTRNYQLSVSELGPPEYQNQQALEQPLELTVHLAKPCAIYDTRSGKFLGKNDSVTFPLDKIQPAILAFLPEPVEALKIDAPAEATGGDMMDVKLNLVTPQPGDMHVFHLVVTAPDGKEVQCLTQNVSAPKGVAAVKLPIARSDAKGQYVLTARDAATGVTGEWKVMVK